MVAAPRRTLMTDSKRTKRERDDSERLTLDEHIQRRRDAFLADRRVVPDLLREADRLEAEASGLVCRYQARMAGDLRCRAAEIRREAKVRQSMTREHEFESQVVTYLRMYHERSGPSPAVAVRPSSKSDSIEAYVRQTDTTQQRRNLILDEYLTDVDRAPPKVAMAARDECPRCDGGSKLLLCSARSIMSCPRCGYCVSFLDMTSSSTSFDEVVEFSQYSYKRVNHYQMHLQLVQGKEAHRVPDDVLDVVMADLHDRQKVSCPADITQKRVRDALRRHKQRKAYDHVAQITARLSGVRPNRIPPETEERLKNMFLQMQPAFQRHAPSTRTNFLSYSYVLYRCFQILKLDHMLEGLTLLKSREKLEANDAIFRKMSLDLGWPLFDLPPASETTGHL